MAQRQSEFAPAVFAIRWPEIEQRVTQFIRRRGCDRSTSEDLCQEVGLRLFKMWDRVDPDADLWPLVVTITLNLLRDGAVERTRMHLVETPAEVPDHVDTEKSAIAKLELHRVARALNMLNPRYRALLLDTIDDDRPGEADATATRMARSRARTRLKEALEKVSGGVGTLGRRVWDRLRVIDTSATTGLSDGLLQSLVAATVVMAVGASPVQSSLVRHSPLVRTGIVVGAHEAALRRSFLGDQYRPPALGLASSASVHQLVPKERPRDTWTPVTVNGQGVSMEEPDATASVGGDGVRAHVEDDAAGQHVESSPDATSTPPNCSASVGIDGPSTDCDGITP